MCAAYARVELRHDSLGRGRFVCRVGLGLPAAAGNKLVENERTNDPRVEQQLNPSERDRDGTIQNGGG